MTRTRLRRAIGLEKLRGQLVRGPLELEPPPAERPLGAEDDDQEVPGADGAKEELVLLRKHRHLFEISGFERLHRPLDVSAAADVLDARQLHVEAGIDGVALDDDATTVEIQHYDGAIEELDFDSWDEMEIIMIEAPEDWSGSLDIEREDYGVDLELTSPNDNINPLDDIE